MTKRIETTVLIIGGGPVGMTLAIDLAWRGVDVTVVETRAAGQAVAVKCNQISSRSMEVFRRLGLADKLREAGLPENYPVDVVSATTVTGIELSRLSLPPRADRKTSIDAPDSWWPTPEPSHRVNQMFFEPILFEHARSQERIHFLNRTMFENYVQDEQKVVARVTNLDTNEATSITAQYVVGCDGGKSTVRKMIGGEFSGTTEIQRAQSSYIYAPTLMKLLPNKPAWMYFSLNPRRCGTTISVDGKDYWNVHNFLYNGETSYDVIDRDWAIREILGVGRDFKYAIVSKEDWIGRRLVSSKFQDRRVFICGDAGHLWIPVSGYGMNTGIADAADLAWMLAAALEGWADPRILEAYEPERQPITEQASHLITEVAVRVMKQRRAVPKNIEEPGPEGDATRARIAKEAFAIDARQQCAVGLNYGYYYENSPIIAYDDETHPPYGMHHYRSSTVPGSRAPHIWLSGRRSLYDALGRYYTLLRTDHAADVSGLVEAAAKRGMPLEVLDVERPEAFSAYDRKLTLVRPDQHVAWRGDEQPVVPSELIDLVRGSRP
jgi:2-polyprenyl-6-methoxyphenol hydroxylase-like FAD-dependent oxidoreductase